MRLHEIDISPEHDKPSDDESDDIVLTQFTDEDDIDPELRELSQEILKAENSAQARMILSLYFPEFNWGGAKV